MTNGHQRDAERHEAEEDIEMKPLLARTREEAVFCMAMRVARGNMTPAEGFAASHPLIKDISMETIVEMREATILLRQWLPMPI